ncbi:hypothetical protein PT015_02070 [Candidatus Mycobacterium wuenschmannii]|uniref:Secreted protein n=1 Tax=Candidatus Mycobacterium wuenschmannii TaxID=3027808 RepID=A0ABY8VXW6_9MYCO|nr:hypothetical protein [Candidatus Mycobacterium wuenschmannii]WIM88322.1 hypothetical protein PT015_02070 [Candidatus Mycobacterium wuenschmannii]
MKRLVLPYVVGAMAATAIGFSPLALADDFFPPGTDQIGDRTYIADVFNEPFYRYAEYSTPYEVLSGDESLGQFTSTSTYFLSPYQPFGIWTLFQSELISDSSYSGLADGATHQDLSFSTLTLTGLLTLFSSDYYDNPGIGTSLDISFFGGPDIPIWDITYDTAGGAATDPGGLGDLLGMDFSSLGDWFGSSVDGLGNLFDPSGLLGIDPGAFADFVGFDPTGLTVLAGLF